MKRIIRIISCLAVVLSLFAVPVNAAGTEVTSIQFLDFVDYRISTQNVYFDILGFARIEPEGVPASELIVTSSDESVIQPLSGGTCRAAGVGKAVITISAASNPAIKDSHEFEIIEPEKPEKMIAIRDTEVTMYSHHGYAVSPVAVTYVTPGVDSRTSWESSDNSVVQVYGEFANPDIYAGKPGTATVTATSIANPELSVTFKVTVTDDIPSSLYTITLRKPIGYEGDSEPLPDPLELKVGETAEIMFTANFENAYPLPGVFVNGGLFQSELLEITDVRGTADVIQPENTMTWFLKVKAVKAGTETCKIGSASFRAKVSGSSENKEVKRIWFSDTSYTIPVGNPFVLIPHTDPGDTTSKITITSSNPNVVSNDDNLLFAEKTGTSVITASAENGVKASCTIRVVFTDVPAQGKYYSDAVYWAVDQGITNGYKDDDGYARTFKPENFCTREAVVTFLWRLAGKPEPKSMTSKFRDVKDKSKYYYKAVLWAAEKGITGGYSDGTFRPSDTCLREHVVTFLWRYAGKPEPGVSKNPFNDVKSSDYYYKAALWANAKGIAKGYTSGEHAGGFGPKLDCLREHVVTFLYRYGK